MRKFGRGLLWVLALCCTLSLRGGVTALAQGRETVRDGIYAGGVDLSGMTADEAREAVQSFVDGLGEVRITLLAAGDREVPATAGELGISWANPELVDDALEIGRHGNVIERYKVMKDLQHSNKVYEIRLAFDPEKIRAFLSDYCVGIDMAARDMSLVREEGEFRVVEGAVGYALDVESSAGIIEAYLTQEWDYNPCVIRLDVAVREPRGSAEELMKVKDVLGSFTTVYSASVFGRKANVENGCGLIDGTLLYPGDEFSTHDTVAPFTQENGYYMAGSYVSGKVVDSLGGGICQVSTTLYNAVLMAELEVTKRYNHSMTVSYVELSMDAAIAESSGKDFRFVNSLEHPVYIEGYCEDRKITFNIYGVETRPENREVRYESEVLETTPPSADVIYADPGQPIGYIVTESAYTGYQSRLWKVVLEDGEEVSRTPVNNSNYRMVPRSATVGIATEDEDARSELLAALETSDIDHVKNVIAALTAPPASDVPEYENDTEEWE